MTDTQFKFRDRVRLSEQGILTLAARHPLRIGTVTQDEQHKQVLVLWDGRKSVDQLAAIFLEKVTQ